MPPCVSLDELKSMKAKIEQYECSAYLRGRIAGCIGSYYVLKPGTLAGVVREYEEFMRSKPKPRPFTPPRRTARTYNERTNRRTPLAGMEIGENGEERAESCDLLVDLVLRKTEAAVCVRVEKRNIWIPKSQIMDVVQRPDQRYEYTVPLWWVRTVPLPEYL